METETDSPTKHNVEVPDEIREAAILVMNWFGMNGFGQWEYLQLCHRDHARQIREMKESPEGLDAVRLTHFEQNNRDFRYHSHPTMDGRYPCWIVRTRNRRIEKKTLREAIDASMNPEDNGN